MGSGPKTTTTQNQTQNTANTAQYGWQQNPGSGDIDAYKAWRPQVDQGLSSQYENAKNNLKSSFVNPLGGYSTPQMRDAQQRTGLRQLNQDEAQAFRGGIQDVNSQRGAQLGSIAALTAPTLTQTGSTGTGTMSGTGTSQQSGGLGQMLLQGAIGVGSSALL